MINKNQNKKFDSLNKNKNNGFWLSKEVYNYNIKLNWTLIDCCIYQQITTYSNDGGCGYNKSQLARFFNVEKATTGRTINKFMMDNLIDEKDGKFILSINDNQEVEKSYPGEVEKSYLGEVEKSYPGEVEKSYLGEISELKNHTPRVEKSYSDSRNIILQELKNHTYINTDINKDITTDINKENFSKEKKRENFSKEKKRCNFTYPISLEYSSFLSMEKNLSIEWISSLENILSIEHSLPIGKVLNDTISSIEEDSLKKDSVENKNNIFPLEKVLSKEVSVENKNDILSMELSFYKTALEISSTLEEASKKPICDCDNGKIFLLDCTPVKRVDCPKCKEYYRDHLLKYDINEAGFDISFLENLKNYQGEIFEGLEKIENYVKDFIDGKITKFPTMFLFGKSSCQKTTMIKAMMTHLILNGHKNIKYVKTQELIRLLHDANFITNMERIESINKLKEFMKSEILVLDDFTKAGIWKNNDDQIDWIIDFLKNHMEDNKINSTIFISNSTMVLGNCEKYHSDGQLLELLKRKCGDRIFDFKNYWSEKKYRKKLKV